MQKSECFKVNAHHSTGTMYASQVDLVHKADKRRVLWVSASTFYFQTVYPAVIDSLQKKIRCWLSSKSERQRNAMHVVLNGFVSIMRPHFLIGFDNTLLTSKRQLTFKFNYMLRTIKKNSSESEDILLMIKLTQ